MLRAELRSHLKICLRFIFGLGLKSEIDLKSETGLSQSETSFGPSYVTDFYGQVINLRSISDLSPRPILS